MKEKIKEIATGRINPGGIKEPPEEPTLVVLLFKESRKSCSSLPGIYFITLTNQAGNKVTKKVVKM